MVHVVGAAKRSREGLQVNLRRGDVGNVEEVLGLGKGVSGLSERTRVLTAM